VNLRSAKVSDAAGIVALEELLFGLDAWSLPSVRDELAAGDRFCTVALSDDTRIVGYLVTLLAGDVVDLQRVGVHPDEQRHGIARALLQTALERARADGADRMLLEVSDGNAAALAFYTTEGFVEIDRRRRYYRDGSDALVLCRYVGERIGR
jgi:ribosomal-protein-alanine N-acetyltransferase